MTLEELWMLFPIVLTPHNNKWSSWAKEEMSLLSNLLAKYKVVINHIGSTAIPGICAKPIVDILVEASPDTDWQRIKETLENTGYICMSESENRIGFNKGYTSKGYAERVFHIHVHRTGDNDEIGFRDYLIAHPETAKEYERLKLSLLPKYM
ncbi:MAG: GrpB family protein, partial [Muribaculaceae bacterium]|nr:GrpB family protein [Muribaculaceae bacterium]